MVRARLKLLLYSPWSPLEPYSTTEYEGVMGGPWDGEPIGGVVYYSRSLVNDNLHLYVFPARTTATSISTMSCMWIMRMR